MRNSGSRLATLLRIREFELTRVGADYAHAAHRLATVGAMADEWTQRVTLGRASLLRRLREGERAVVLRTAVAGVQLLGNASVDAERQLESARATTEQAHALLLSARTRVRALEQLRDRLAQQELTERTRAEQRELDEVALRRNEFGRSEP